MIILMVVDGDSNGDYNVSNNGDCGGDDVVTRLQNNSALQTLRSPTC